MVNHFLNLLEKEMEKLSNSLPLNKLLQLQQYQQGLAKCLPPVPVLKNYATTNVAMVEHNADMNTNLHMGSDPDLAFLMALEWPMVDPDV